MLYNLFPKFKIVEINNVAALRMGHVIAQTPAEVDGVPVKEVGEYKFLENGAIVGYDASGSLKSYDAAKHAQPCLVYTEELVTSDLLEGLDQFANLFEGDVCYPRALPLNLGDTFTTNNVDSVKAGYAYVQDGVLTIDETYELGKHMFIAKVSDLPAGQPAVEFTYIGLTAPAESA